MIPGTIEHEWYLAGARREADADYEYYLFCTLEEAGHSSEEVWLGVQWILEAEAADRRWPGPRVVQEEQAGDIPF